MLLVNNPVVPDSLVLLSEVVGLAEVLQHAPRAVMVSPPSAVTFPPDEVVVEVMLEAVVVVTVGLSR